MRLSSGEKTGITTAGTTGITILAGVILNFTKKSFLDEDF